MKCGEKQYCKELTKNEIGEGLRLAILKQLGRDGRNMEEPLFRRLPTERKHDAGKAVMRRQVALRLSQSGSVVIEPCCLAASINFILPR
jgi:hypothetical protein